jgi:hypothetical protein
MSRNIREKVNRAKSGSKTAEMDVMDFLYVSLGSSTAQRHNRLGSRCTCTYSEACLSSQNGNRA